MVARSRRNRDPDVQPCPNRKGDNCYASSSAIMAVRPGFRRGAAGRGRSRRFRFPGRDGLRIPRPARREAASKGARQLPVAFAVVGPEGGSVVVSISMSCARS